MRRINLACLAAASAFLLNRIISLQSQAVWRPQQKSVEAGQMREMG